MGDDRTGAVRILHVEDDAGFADLTSSMLARTAVDLDVLTERNGEAALDRLDEGTVDCVVSDFDMPGMDGLDLLRAVREQYPDLPFVLFTGKGSEEIASEAISAGVTDYLQKSGGPDRFERLAKRVQDAVERYRSEERYHNLVDTAPVPIALFGADGCLVYANDAAVEFLHADSAAELLGRPIPSFVHDDDRELAAERFQRVTEDAVPAERTPLRIRTVDGTYREAVVATAPGHYEGERVAQVVVRTPVAEEGPDPGTSNQT